MTIVTLYGTGSLDVKGNMAENLKKSSAKLTSNAQVKEKGGHSVRPFLQV
jgi:hypothetical protein